MITASPTRDAECYYDALDLESQHLEAKQVQAATEIREAFNSHKPVPFVESRGKLRYMPFNEAVSDALAYDETFAQLINTLKTSDCPQVKALLKAMAERHVQMWADDIAEVV